uniref:Uncharacterized protein n=1 Tax=Parascaris univalens TaxID=6257 RepID=A0A915CIQ5_PARUN
MTVISPSTGTTTNLGGYRDAVHKYALTDDTTKNLRLKRQSYHRRRDTTTNLRRISRCCAQVCIN